MKPIKYLLKEKSLYWVIVIRNVLQCSLGHALSPYNVTLQIEGRSVEMEVYIGADVIIMLILVLTTHVLTCL